MGDNEETYGLGPVEGIRKNYQWLVDNLCTDGQDQTNGHISDEIWENSLEHFDDLINICNFMKNEITDSLLKTTNISTGFEG